jgi:hypothetical protein
MSDGGPGAFTVLRLNLWGGFGIGLLGAIIAIATEPGTKVNENIFNPALNETVTTGSEGWHNFGMLVFAIGTILMTVAIIGYGVYLGMRAERDSR